MYVYYALNIIIKQFTHQVSLITLGKMSHAQYQTAN